MEHWLNVLKQDENNIEALFWLANNNDKHQKEYIEKGLTIDPNNILLKACSLRYTHKYLNDIVNNLNVIDEIYLGYIYLELGKYYREINFKKFKTCLYLSIKYGNLVAYMYLHINFKVNIDKYKKDIFEYIKKNKLDTNMHYYLGIYNLYVEEEKNEIISCVDKYFQMKFHFRVAIQQGNHHAMNSLGNYYTDIEKNDEEMKKYYLMAIENGSHTAMFNLGNYYNKNEQYDKMKTYWLMAIEHGNSEAMFSLGLYYQQIEKNDEEIKKYYLMAIEHEYLDAMFKLGNYYKDIENNEKEMKKYLLMALEYGDDTIFNFDKYYQEIKNDEKVKNEIEISEEDKELIILEKQINTLDDLIELGKMYDKTKKYNIDLKILHKLVEPLTELNNMIGMKKIKEDIVDYILFKVQNLDKNNDMMHTIIQGPPGVGKTEIAKIIGKIYLNMGMLKNDTFIKAKRSDLIGKYTGHTARATQEQIDKALGGILFIDEVYSLGHPERIDSFSKECIDTINENLTEHKDKFICIVAGYAEDIKSCFLNVNQGLERRFPIRFTIEPYNANELFLIFQKKVIENEWQLYENVKMNFFDEHYKDFKYFGGDMEILYNKCKISHSRRIFTSSEPKKIITITDLQNGFNLFKENQHKIDETDNNINYMYI
jgi:SpoVK/Ycf46/Vps4 family AAA+-type ATPase